MTTKHSDSNDFMEALFLLGSNNRQKILQSLNDRPMKLSELAKEVNCSVVEGHRNVNRLYDAGMIKKSDGVFSITHYGKRMLLQLSYFKFLSLNKEYFETHQLEFLPLKFIQRIGVLNKCEIYDDLISSFEKWDFIIENSSEYLKAIIPIFPDHLLDKITKKLTEEIDYNVIYGNNTIFSTRKTEILRKNSYQEFIKKGKTQRKFVDDVPIMLLFSEKYCSMIFRNQSGKFDLSRMYFSNDTYVNEWCSDLFNHYWENSQEFTESQLKDLQKLRFRQGISMIKNQPSV